jgi:hypothetical protein
MRKTLLAAAVATTVMTLMPAFALAGSRSYYVCWMQPSGTSECANLPDDYQIGGVKKPYCNEAQRCNKGSVDFALTHSTIACLSQYVDTSTMKPTNWATVYAPSHR